jgi:hypothetical protein
MSVHNTATQNASMAEVSRDPVLRLPTQPLTVTPRKRQEKVDMGKPGDCTGPSDQDRLFPRLSDAALTINCSPIFLLVMIQSLIITAEDKDAIMACRTSIKRAVTFLECIETHVASGRYRSIDNLRDVLCYHLEVLCHSATVDVIRRS